MTIDKNLITLKYCIKKKQLSPILSSWILITCFIMHQPSTTALSLFPDMFKYKTCADSAPEFSLGCMANVTVNIGERATFNCQVSYSSMKFEFAYEIENLHTILN